MSRLARAICVLLGVGLIAPTWAHAAPRPRARSLSLAQARALARSDSHDIAISRAVVHQARAKRKATFHRYFPMLKITGNLLYWDSDLPFDIPPVQSSPDCPLPAGCLTLFTDLLSSLKVRERLTAQISIRLIQPLTPLYSIHQLNRLDSLGVRVARTKLDATRQQVRHNVTQAYILAYQAQVLATIMRSADRLVKGHTKRIKMLLAEDMVRRAELLKVQVKAAQVKQTILKARAAVELSKSNLARVVGLDINTPLTLTERFRDPPLPYPLTLKQCTARAMRQRAELRLTRLGAAQLRAGRKATLGQLIPTVAAVAQFDANHGLGVVMPKTSFFVGAVLQWDFEWGRKIRQADVLTARLNRVRAMERKARSVIPLQVKKLYLDLRVARASLKVAKTAVRAAAESHRIQIKRFELRANSSTDVLDAQMELTQAKGNAANALYKYYLAKAALDRAMGVHK